MPRDYVRPRDQARAQRLAAARKALADSRFLAAQQNTVTVPRDHADSLGDEILQFIQDGSWMTKLSATLKGSRRYFFFNKSAKCLCYEGSRKWNKAKAKFHIRDVVDVRFGFQSDTFNKMSDRLKESCCLSVIFRSHVRPPLDLIADAPEIRDAWLKGLRYAKYCHDQLMLQQDEQALIKDLFYSADVTDDSLLQFDEVWQLLQRMNIKMSRDDAKAKFTSMDRDKARDRRNHPTLNLREFVHFYHELCRRPEVDELFNRLKDKGGHGVLPERLQRFMVDEQKELGFSVDDARQLIAECQAAILHPQQREQPPSLSLDGFYFMLNSRHFNAFDQRHGTAYQDMTQPLSHYFINSSHNTYLVGDQLTGRSSIEGYIQALMDGCRCVELDCWDGPDNNPVVYHGYTLTTKLMFRDIIEDAIRQYAFYSSDYPVILSLENHCSIEQQEVMALILKKALGDKLYSAPVDSRLTRLPSPKDLKGKILIKCKKNKPQADAVATYAYDELDAALAESSDELEDNEDTKMNGREEPDGGSVGPKERSKKKGVAPGLSDLVNYVQAVSFKGFRQGLEQGKFYEISSHSEKKALSLIKQSPTEFVRLNELQLSRTYPKGTRTESSNYSPVDMWNVGTQIVALNFQTDDEGMQICRGKFKDNGGCGYVLKPEFMRHPRTDFNPYEETAGNTVRQYVRMKVISGFQLPKPRGLEDDKDIVDPFVMIHVYGAYSDCIEMKTAKIKDNGLNPRWNEDFMFYVNIPQLAIIHFVVQDSNAVTASELIGQYCLPFTSLRQGYRHVKLESPNGKPLGLAEILIHVSMQDRPFPDYSSEQLKMLLKKVKAKNMHREKSVASAMSALAGPVASQGTPQATNGGRAADGRGNNGAAPVSVAPRPSHAARTGTGRSRKAKDASAAPVREFSQLESSI